jgi:hypothetical protein
MNRGAPDAGPRYVVLGDIDWRPVTRDVVWMPAAYRSPTLDENMVTRILRCTPASLAALRDLGLTAQETPEGLRYDLCDVRNAALYSRSNRTEVESAMRRTMSFLRGSDHGLFGERHWTYEMRLGTAESYLVHPLTPEVCGGRTLVLSVDGATPRRVGGRVAVAAGKTLRGTIVTRGRAAPIRSPYIRSVTAEFLASGVRWHYMPLALQRDASAAFAAGIGNCDTLSTILAGRLAAAGLTVSIYRGWIVGLTELRHSWLEVTDDDGQVKVVDPALLLLAAHSGLASPDFADRAFGGRLSCVAPTRCQLGEPMAITASGQVPGEVRFVCRPSRAAVRS